MRCVDGRFWVRIKYDRFFFLMIRRPPRSTQSRSSAASDVYKRQAEGSRHTGLVKNITNYGVFVELAPGIGGMIHISDCLLYTSPSPRDRTRSRMPSSA